MLNIQNGAVNNSQHIHTPAHTHSHATGHTASLWASALSSTANTAGECVLFSTTYIIYVFYITLSLSLAQGFPQTWCCSRLSVVFCSLGSRVKHTLTHRPLHLDSHQYTNLPVQNISTDMWETLSKLLNCIRRQHFTSASYVSFIDKAMPKWVHLFCFKLIILPVCVSAGCYSSPVLCTVESPLYRWTPPTVTHPRKSLDTPNQNPFPINLQMKV